MAVRRMQDLVFTIEQWTADEAAIEEKLAEASNAVVARAAFTAACRQRPTSVILLRHGIRVVEAQRPGTGR
ncbi:hypothetical protein GTW51_10090 [Aurantimonas aggregata]|uniref:Uncharacterized protein n=1 Tax=Aurantimonas aggregata TaxID=2047720 RepID=A0A6L9MH85_9HYPH|nr:hypothetical protein [Aurantimonas aggregata]NDV87051.1 hypothetical protein [Aurantimonas aggregata]